MNRCEFVAPLSSTTGSPIGLILVPGAHLPGVSYLPLLQAVQVTFPMDGPEGRHCCVQAAYPGPLWVGATSEWNNDMPTPFEVSAQVLEGVKKGGGGGDRKGLCYGGLDWNEESDKKI